MVNTVLLGATLVACSSDGDDKNTGGQVDGTDRTNAAMTRGTEQSTQGNGSTHGNGSTVIGSPMGGQDEYVTVTTNCLHSMDLGGWRALGLNADQLARVQRLQQNSLTTIAPGSNAQGEAQAAGSGTQSAPGDGGSPASGQVSVNSTVGTDQGSHASLSEILTSEQLASMARMCKEGKSGRADQ
jgi:hypothetical protein